MYFVYVLKSISSGKFYKGFTNNFDRRLKEHILGKNRTTRNMLPLVVVHVELCERRNEARTVEKFLKSGFGREIIQEITQDLNR
ncbi:MAG TPA: GIY-YIG nuclease family protein [Candidatus Wunengus sp. YC60]|uniref:GIY-YIG nuclease family protein n=1 Tax=Candidatus Wunengus sp. YC60 TaxID=3367697 RepID=UPI004024BCAB